MTKRDVVESIRAMLAGGDITNDPEGRYRYDVVEAALNAVFSTVAEQDANASSAMVIGYDVTLDLSSDRYISTLPVAPLVGPKSVKYIEDGSGNMYFGRNGVDQSVTMDIIYKSDKAQYSTFGNEVKWSKKPVVDVGSTLTAYVIPDVISMDDEDYFCSPKYFDTIYKNVVTFLMQTGQAPQEKINNTKQDR